MVNMRCLKCKVSECFGLFSPHQIEWSDAHADASPEVGVRRLLLFCNFCDIFQSLTISVMETQSCLSAQFSSGWFCTALYLNLFFFSLKNLIAVSDSHPSFDESDDALIQERERSFLQENFSVAQLCMHLLCQWKHLSVISCSHVGWEL